jgi:hypothetical protein
MMAARRPEIHKFVNPVSGQIDFDAWQQDLIGRMIQYHQGPGNSTTTRAVCQFYFGFVDFEHLTLVGQQMQIVRARLIAARTPVIIRNQHRRWYAVEVTDTAGARGFVAERARRFLRLYSRIQTYSGVAQTTYKLPAGDPLVTAIQGVSPAIPQIEQASKS